GPRMTALATRLEATPATTAPPNLFRRLSSVFLVDRIEPCLDFWVDRLGFEVRLRIDGEDHLEFVALGRDDVEFFYRTRDSVRQDAPELPGGAEHAPWVVIYLEVECLDDLLPKLEGIEVIAPVRETAFGGHELFLREPSGRIVALVDHNPPRGATET